MSDISTITEQIRENQAFARRLDSAVAEDPSDFAMSLWAQSTHQWGLVLEDRLADATVAVGHEVMNYRIFKETDPNPPFAVVAKAFIELQAAITLAFDAFKNGPKEQARTSERSEVATAFRVAYTYTGSLGIVLSVPNDLVLFAESDLDRSVNAVLTLAEARSSDQVMKLVELLGPAPVRKIYAWADEHLKADTGVEIEWLHGKERRGAVRLTVSDLKELRQAMRETGDEVNSEFQVVGSLVGADITPPRFRIDAGSAGTFRGAIAEGVLAGVLKGIEELHLPRRYLATIAKRSVTSIATGEESVFLTLVELDDVPSAYGPVDAADGPQLTLS